MRGRTHVLMAYLGARVLTPSASLSDLGVAALCALLPDVDHPESPAGSLVRPISEALPHRGFIHSVEFFLFACLLVFFLARRFFAPFAIGFGSHLFLDSLTRSGIIVFGKRRGLRLLRTGGIGDHVLFFLLAGVILAKEGGLL